MSGQDRIFQRVSWYIVLSWFKIIGKTEVGKALQFKSKKQVQSGNNTRYNYIVALLRITKKSL